MATVSTYPVVTRGMALDTADRYLALLSFLAEKSVCKNMFVLKRSANLTEQVGEEGKTRSIEARTLRPKAILNIFIICSEPLRIYCVGPMSLALKTKHAS